MKWLTIPASLLIIAWALPTHADLKDITEPAHAIEGCQWVVDTNQWEYPDQTPCRGTGEDPTTDAAGNPACANHNPAIAHHRYGTTVYSCTNDITKPTGPLHNSPEKNQSKL